MKHPNDVLQYDWESLDEGETARIHCSHWKCEDKKDALTITRVLGGCIYNCYRCGTSGGIFKGSSPTEAAKRLRLLRENRHSCTDSNTDCVYRVALPPDTIAMCLEDDTIPPHAYAWLYQYELNEDDFFEYNIGYSPKLERIIIPFYYDNKLVGWQGRDAYASRNKLLYEKGVIKNKPLKWYTEYNNKEIKLYYKLINTNINNIFIVEDTISAIKVYNKYKYPTIALLNSTLNTSLIDDLNLRNYKTVHIWLDPDAHVKAMQGALRWRSLGINARSIRTGGDPKAIPYERMPQI